MPWRREGDKVEPQPASWGESIESYRTAKLQRPHPDEAYAKPRRVTRYEKSREEVSYHPILQTFSDTSKETQAKQVEVAGRVSQLNQARDRQITVESPYNILNMHDKRSGLEKPMPPAPAALASSAHSERPSFRHPLDSC